MATTKCRLKFQRKLGNISRVEPHLRFRETDTSEDAPHYFHYKLFFFWLFGENMKKISPISDVLYLSWGELEISGLSCSYESSASHRVSLPFTGAACWQAHDESKAKMCLTVCALVCTEEFSWPEDRNLSMAAEIVNIAQIPLESKQLVTSLEARKKEGEAF